MQAKRLYEMGGDITSNFYPSALSSSESMLIDGKRKKASRKANKYNKRNICRQGMKCWNPNSR